MRDGFYDDKFHGADWNEVMFDREDYEKAGRLKVAPVVPLGPAAISKQINAGDYIVSLNGVGG